jgi:NADPH-dependent ferric siderophore reductase
MFIMAAVLASALAMEKPRHPRHQASLDSSNVTLIEVQNDRHVPVAVYAQDAYGEVELGVVPADSTVTLRLRDAFVGRGDVDFFVHPKGAPDQDTGYLDVRRGERLGIVVPPR